VIYSLDNGTTWSSGPTVSAFPVNFTLPSLTPPTYTGVIQIAIRAEDATCTPSADTSDTYLTLNLTDRPGNRLATAIPLTLTDNGNGTWSVVVQDSTDGLGISNEYGSGNSLSGGGNPRGTGAPELFFKLVLPECFDSLKVRTCASYTNFDTYVSLLHATELDTIANDDGCPGFKSQLVAIGRVNTLKIYTGDLTVSPEPTRDTMRLKAGDELYILVEGWEPPENGKFELSVTGYKQQQLPQPVIDGAPSSNVCENQGPVTLQATGATGANAYEWEINGNVDLSNATGSYSLNLAPGSHTVVVRAIYDNPNGPDCNDTVASQPVTITVDPLPAASIQVGSTTYANGATLTLSGTGSVSETFNATSSVSGNTYTWNLYSGATSVATGSGSSFSHTFNTTGVYLLKLTSTNGACTEDDTLYVDVTVVSGLLSGVGSFSVMPNPSRGAFMVVAPAAGTYELRVLDVAGREVYRDRMEGVRKELRLSLPAGTYQLLIRGEGRSGVVRLLITE